MRKLLSVVLLVAMLVSIAAVSNTAAAGEKTYSGKVRVAWLNMNERDTMDPINGLVTKGSKAFKELLEQKMPGIEIEIISIPGDGWIQKMETTLTSGEADVGWYTNQVMAAEWFVDHREFMANDPEFTEEDFEAMFTPGAKHYTRYHTYNYPQYTDAIYGLPYDVGAYWLMYDQKIFDDWGLEFPENPTYDNLLDLAQKMTGTNPVTGKKNYGAYVKPYWCEWLGVGADLYHVIDDPEMDINKLDIAKDVDYIKDSPEVLHYFELLEGFIATAPVGTAAGTGNEKWMTEDNDIAIMLATDATGPYMSHLLGGNTHITERFKPFLPINGKMNVSAFPEVHHVAVAKNATDKELAWEVVKMICTDTDMLNLIFANYAQSGVPALADPSALDIMKIEFSALRYQDRLEHTLITDDYWYWREPINKIFSSLFSGDLNAESARAAFHANVVEWVQNKKLQLGQ